MTGYYRIPNDMLSLGLNVYELGVFNVIAQWQRAGSSSPSYTVIATTLGISRPVVQRAIEVLQAKNVIRVAIGKQRSYIYELVNEIYQSCEGSGKPRLPDGPELVNDVDLSTTFTSQRGLPEVVNEDYQSGKRGLPQVVNHVDTTNKETRLTKKTKNKTPPSPRVRHEYSDAFEAFWSEYPDCERKVDKVGAYRVWVRKSLDDRAGHIMDGLARWKASEQWAKNGGEFIKSVEAWLNQDYFNAKPKPASAPTNGAKPSRAPDPTDPLEQAYSDFWSKMHATGIATPGDFLARYGVSLNDIDHPEGDYSPIFEYIARHRKGDNMS